jgi:hypothetical protein
MRQQRLQVWSCGGGTQSAAIAAMISNGTLPRPDVAVIADTGYEQQTTWKYLDTVLNPALGGLIQRVRSQDWATVGLWSLKSQDLLIPAFTTQSGRLGKLPTYCSQEWKKRVVQRFIASTYHPKAVTNWLGFSIDEQHRAKQERGKWQRRFPLLEHRMTRDMSIALVQRMGWPTPPRSSCWMCPNHHQRDWRQIKTQNPQDWEKAIAFERAIQQSDPQVWLHHSGTPLAIADLGEAQEVLFQHCENEACFT